MTRAQSSFALFPRPRLARALIVLATLALAALGADGHWFERTEWLFVENGPVEYSQLLLLVLAGGGFFVAFLRAGHSIGLINLVLAFACVLMASREIPRCASPFYDGGLCLTSGEKSGLLLASALVASACLFFKPSIRPHLPGRAALGVIARHALWGWPLLIAGAFLVSAEISEQIALYHTEEVVETAAYSYLAAVALWSACHARFLARSVEQRLAALEDDPS